MPSAYPQIHDGCLHTGHYLFIRPRAGLSDRALLDLLGLDTHHPVEQVGRFDRYVVLCDAGDWLLVADDLRYSLFHSRVTASPAFAELARDHEIFVCVEGDCDRSFEYRHFVDGALVRDVEVDSPLFSDRTVVRDTGVALPGERELLQQDGNDIGLAVAGLLGIPTRVKAEALRLYAP